MFWKISKFYKNICIYMCVYLCYVCSYACTYTAVCNIPVNGIEYAVISGQSIEIAQF